MPVVATPVRGVCLVAVVLAGLVMLPFEAEAQQRLAYIDSDYILEQMPEFATVEENLDRLAREMEAELEEREEEIDAMFEEYQARELLYSQEERQQQRQEIVRAEEELDQLHEQYFGPEGEFYQQQEEMMEPIQERILAVVEGIAAEEGYDYVFDRSGDVLFLYADEAHNLSERVLEQLGIDLEATEEEGAQ